MAFSVSCGRRVLLSIRSHHALDARASMHALPHSVVCMSHGWVQGGNTIKVDFFNYNTNLHSVWDTSIIRRIIDQVRLSPWVWHVVSGMPCWGCRVGDVVRSCTGDTCLVPLSADVSHGASVCAALTVAGLRLVAGGLAGGPAGRARASP